MGKPRVPVLSSGSRDFVIRNSKGSRNQSTYQFAVRVPRIGVVGGGSCEETATQLCASFGLASGREVRSHSRHIRCSHMVILRQSWDSNRWAIFSLGLRSTYIIRIMNAWALVVLASYRLRKATTPSFLMVYIAVSLEWSRVNSSVQSLKSSLMQGFIEIPYMTFYDQIVYIYIYIYIEPAYVSPWMP